MKSIDQLSVKIFADGADLPGMVEMYRQPYIKGFTTNPTLMRKAGITNYGAFARQVVQAIPDRPISFEVFSDEFADMERQAREIATWGKNVYVKVPVTNTRRESACDIIRRLSHEGVQLNVTALMTLDQVRDVSLALSGGAPACVSVFAGRLADLGIDYRPIMKDAVARARQTANVEIIWASTREVFNVIEGDEIGCHIITAPADILKKLPAIGSKSGAELSLDGVKAFRDDALAAGLVLRLPGASQAAE